MARAFIRRRYRKDPASGKRRLAGFEVEWRDANGKRRRKLHDTHAAAAAHRDQLNAPKTEPAPGQPVGDQTVEKAGEAWIERVKADGRARVTWTKYDQRLKRHIAPLMVAARDGEEPRRFGDYKLAELSTPLIVRFKTELQKAGRSPAMVQKVMADLRMMLKSAELVGEITSNVAAPVRAKRGERHKEPVAIPTPEQVRTILGALEGETVTFGQAWITMAAMTGMRPGEMRALAWPKVHLDATPPYVEVAAAADDKGVIGPPKSKAGYRKIPLSPRLVVLLRKWKLRCPKSGDRQLVFPTSAGHVYSLSNIHNRIWRPLLKALHSDELPFIRVLPAIDPDTKEHLWEPLFTPYALRHWYASYLIQERGKNPKQVQRLMGHENIELTFQIYGHLWADPEDDAAVAAGLDELLAVRRA